VFSAPSAARLLFLFNLTLNLINPLNKDSIFVLDGPFSQLLRCQVFLCLLDVLQYTSAAKKSAALYWQKNPHPKV